MKKIFMVFALMAMLMLPFTSFSMTAMEEGDLSSVTGQAGVSINLDVRVDLGADVLAWGDADGIAGTNTANAGWVGLTDLAITNLRIRADQTLLEAEFFLKHGGEAKVNALTGAAGAIGIKFAAVSPAMWALAAPSLTPTFDPADYTTWTTDDLTFLVTQGVITPAEAGAFGSAYLDLAPLLPYSPSAAKLAAEIAAGDFTPFAPLTIDVATDSTTHGTIAGTTNPVTFVRIGLGSLQIAMDSMTAKVKLGPGTTIPAVPPTYQYSLDGVTYISQAEYDLLDPAVQATYGQYYLTMGTPAGVDAATPNMKYELGNLYLAGLSLRVGGNSYIDIFNARGEGKQGVSIYVNATIKDFAIGTLAWGDADGIDWGFSYIAGSQTPGTTKLWTDDAQLQTPDANDPIADAEGWVGLKDLSIAKITAVGQVDIDVATRTSDSWTFVQINLGSSTTPFHVGLSGMTATAALGPAETNLNQELGEIYVSGVGVDVYGALQIGARSTGGQGVDINLSQLNVAINQGLTVSWGDLDGIDTVGYTAGYVGLSALNIVGLTLDGMLSIDVATVDTSVTTYTATTIRDMMYAGYVENNLSPTFVHIGLGSGDASSAANALTVGITSLSAGVTFANNAALTAGRTIGSLFIGGLDVGINGWVDIAAH